MPHFHLPRANREEEPVFLRKVRVPLLCSPVLRVWKPCRQVPGRGNRSDICPEGRDGRRRCWGWIFNRPYGTNGLFLPSQPSDESLGYSQMPVLGQGCHGPRPLV
jgi:hypothetical protein